MFDLLRYGKELTSDERKILLSQTTSAVSDFMAFPAFLILAQGHSPETVSIFIFFYFIPKFFQPLLGYITDLYSPKMVVMVTDLIRVLISCVFFLLEIDNNLNLWITLIILNSILSSIAEPARFKLLTLVSRNFLSYNSIFNFLLSISAIIALFISIYLELKLETKFVFTFNAFLFLLSIAILYYVKPPEDSDFSYKKSRNQLLLKAVFGGLKYFKHPTLFLFLMGIFLTDFMTGIFYAVFPIQSISLNLGEIGTYIFTVILCLGNALGALRFSSFKDRKKFFPWLLLFSGLSCLLFLNIDIPMVLAVACFGFFFMQIILIGMIEIEIADVVPHKYQGRVFAIGDSLPIIALSLGGMAFTHIDLTHLSLGLLSLTIIFCLIYLITHHTEENESLKTEKY